MIVVTRAHDGFERRISMRDREILAVGRAFVSLRRNTVPADQYISEKTPCVLRRVGTRLLLQNPHSNGVRVRPTGPYASETLKRGRECDVTQRSVRFCPNDETEGVEHTDLTFRLEVDEDQGSETEGEEEEEEGQMPSPIYSLDPDFRVM